MFEGIVIVIFFLVLAWAVITAINSITELLNQIVNFVEQRKRQKQGSAE